MSLLIRLPAIIARILVASARAAAQATDDPPATVHIVNATTSAYTATISSQRLELSPRSVRAIELPAGRTTVAFTDATGVARTYSIDIQPPTARRAQVLNPDRMAVFIDQQCDFDADGFRRPDTTTWRVHTGLVLFRFQEMDYPLTPWPERIEAIDADAPARRLSRLYLARDFTPRELAVLLNEQRGRETMLNWLRAAIEFDDRSTDHFDVLGDVLSPDETVEWARPHLNDGPLHLEWHRLYQDAERARGRIEALRRTYARLLDDRPNDPVAVYLAARLEDDPRVQEEAFIRAIEFGLDSPRPHLWLAVRMLASGRFDEALAQARHAAAMTPHDDDALRLQQDALLALDRPAEARNIAAERGRLRPTDGDLAAEVLVLSVLLDETEQGRQTVRSFLDTYIEQTAPSSTEVWTRYFDALEAYVTGEVDRFTSLLEDADAPHLRYQAAITAGRLDDAMRALNAMELEAAFYDSWSGYLVLAVAAHRAGDEKLFDESWMLAEDALSKASPFPERQRVLGWLRQDAPPPIDEVREAVLYRVQKIALLAALGLRHPPQRHAYFELARTLNFAPTFPHRFYADLLNPAAE